jgi:hypothetical protein
MNGDFIAISRVSLGEPGARVTLPDIIMVEKHNAY